ncbi:vWA domain-containing protein [Jatrophihabitans sp. DSM 45814]
MIDLLAGLVDQLRLAGVPVSTSEAVDAGLAACAVNLLDRAELRSALASTLVKDAMHVPTFDVVFDAYFALRRPISDLADSPDPVVARRGSGDATSGFGGGALSSRSDDEISELLFRALLTDATPLLRLIAVEGVQRYADMQPGRPAGVLLYSYRTLKAFDLDGLIGRLREEDPPSSISAEFTALRDELWSIQIAARIRSFTSEVEADIRRRLVTDRGPDAVAQTLRIPVPADIEFMHANAAQLKAMERAIAPLARKLAAKLALQDRSRRGGALNMPATMRASLTTGGVPLELVTKALKPHKPQIVVLADISGSVSAFASFTLQFVTAVSGDAAHVRSFMFIDGVDEVTEHLKHSRTVGEALIRIREQAALIAGDGHTDYGQVFSAFADRWGQRLSRRTTVLILGDARSNYRPLGLDALRAISKRVDKILWLNPEQKAYWDTGDSVISRYAPYCDGVYECRSIRQLERVAALVE